MAEEKAEQLVTSASFDDIVAVAERPASIDPNDVRGTEDIGVDDIKLPGLRIAQGLSPERQRSSSRYIQGLEDGVLFNDLFKTIYGEGPLTFVPVKRQVKRIEFIPRSAGGGVVDMDVPPNDPRNKWTKDEKGVSVPPKATTFVEFVSLLLRKGTAPEPIVISIKTTNKFMVEAAKLLSSWIKFRKAPIYAGMYTVEAKPETGKSGTFGVFVMKNAGFIPKETPAGAALYDYAEKFSKSLEGKEIIVERDAPTAEDWEGGGREPGSDDV